MVKVRREFLKRAGLASLGIAGMSALESIAAGVTSLENKAGHQEGYSDDGIRKIIGGKFWVSSAVLQD